MSGEKRMTVAQTKNALKPKMHEKSILMHEKPFERCEKNAENGRDA